VSSVSSVVESFRNYPLAPARFFGAAMRVTGAAVFFVELIESRLLRSASIRLTTFGGAST